MPAPGEPREPREPRLNSSNDLGTPPSAGLLLSVAFITVEACGAQCDVEVRLDLEEVWIESEVRVGRESVEHDSGGNGVTGESVRCG